MIKLILVVSIGMMLGAVYLIWNTQGFLQHTIGATGQVTGFETLQDNIYSQDKVGNRKKTGEKTTYYAVIEFKTRNGQHIQFTSDIGYSDKHKYRLGSHINILYNPDKPSEEVRIDSFLSTWGISLLVACLGLVLFVMSLFVLRLPPFKI